MADKFIGQLPEETVGDDDMFIELQDGDGNSRKMSFENFANYLTTKASIVPSALPARGCRVYRSSDVTGVSWPYAISWNVEDFDTDNFWTNASPTRFTIPSGVTKIRLRACVLFEALTTAGSVNLFVNKNNAQIDVGIASNVLRNNTTGTAGNKNTLFTGVLNVSAGDYFELVGNVSMSGQDQVLTNSWFEIEVVEVSP